MGKNEEIQIRMEILAIHLGNFTHKSGQYKQCLFSKRSWKRKWLFAEKVCVSTKCHPNGECNIQLIPVNNRRTQIQKSTKTNHSQKINECVEKKSRPCARVLKKSICAPWHPGRGNACVSCTKIRNKVRKGPNSEYYLRQDILCMEGLDDFFPQLRQNFQCKLHFKWKVMNLEHMDAI